MTWEWDNWNTSCQQKSWERREEGEYNERRCWVTWGEYMYIHDRFCTGWKALDRHASQCNMAYAVNTIVLTSFPAIVVSTPVLVTGSSWTWNWGCILRTQQRKTYVFHLSNPCHKCECKYVFQPLLRQASIWLFDDVHHSAQVCPRLATEKA